MNALLRRIRAAYGLAVARRSALFDLALATITTGVEIGLLFDDGTPVAVTPVVVTVLAGSALLVAAARP